MSGSPAAEWGCIAARHGVSRSCQLSADRQAIHGLPSAIHPHSATGRQGRFQTNEEQGGALLFDDRAQSCRAFGDGGMGFAVKAGQDARPVGTELAGAAYAVPSTANPIPPAPKARPRTNAT